MGTDNSASEEAGRGVPAALAAQITGAAERGDRFAFMAAATRLGSIEEAHALVRSRGIVRMVDRVTVARHTVNADDGEEIRSNDLLPHSELRDGEGDGPTMFGHFAVFNEWTEINSFFEGHFLERIARGAFKKTFDEHRGEIRSLFQHGHDPQIGDKPLGPVEVLSEDKTGGYYEVGLLDAPYVREDVMPGLNAGLYGASFRFRALREEFDEEPGVSDHNPAGIPERTLKEVRVFEFGPVTFPAYPSATASVRAADTSAQEAAAAAEDSTPPAEGAEAKSHPDPLRVGAGAASHPNLGRRGQTTYSLDRKESPSWRL